jgi:hypothetical protein
VSSYEYFDTVRYSEDYTIRSRVFREEVSGISYKKYLVPDMEKPE